MIVSVEVTMSVIDTVAVSSVAATSTVTEYVSTVVTVPLLMVVVASITDTSSTVATEPGISKVWTTVVMYVVVTNGPGVGMET